MSDPDGCGVLEPRDGDGVRDRPRIAEPKASAESVLQTVRGLQEFKLQPSKTVTVAGLAGIETEATARDQRDKSEVALYQLVLVQPGGGYIRIVGSARHPDGTPHAAAFRQIAQSLVLIPQN